MPSRRPLRRGATRRALLPGLFLLLASCGDGGTAPTPRPEPQNPVPSISSLDPALLPQYSDSVTVTITGSGFVNGAVVRLNGNARLTTYVNPSQLTAVVPVAAMQEPATLQVTVFNPAPGGGESAAVPVQVQHRVPTIRSLSPGGSMQGDTAFTMTVEGTGFARASVIRWNGADRPTTFVDPYHLTTRVSAADVDSVGVALVTVFNPEPGGGTASARAFSIVVRPNPVPGIASLSPDTILVEETSTITVRGAGFMAATRLSVGGFSPAVTFVSPTELRFTLEPEHLPSMGFAGVQAINPAPGGGTSGQVTLTVASPAPTLTAATPSIVPIGLDSQVVRLTGTGFTRRTTLMSSFIYVNAPRFVSRTELEVVLRRDDLDEYVTGSIRVLNFEPGGGLSNPVYVSVQNPAPVAQAVTPAQAAAGRADSLTLTVTGAGFTHRTAVHVEGSPRTTQFVSATELRTVLAPGDLDAPGVLDVSVVTPEPGGGSSAAGTLTLTASMPVLEALPSYGASAGRPGYPLVVHGTGFIRSSVIRWNGQARPTTYVSGTRLEMAVTDADLAVPGTAQVSVHTPGVGTSAARQITFRTPGSVSVSGLRVLDLPAADLVYDAARDRLYASITSGPRGNTVVRINPATGEIDGSVGVGSNPGKMALSSDGATLWVGVKGANQVRQVALPGFTAGTAFSTEIEPGELHAMPGQPGTVAVVRGGGLITVYDNGVARRNEGGSPTVTFGESASVMYGFDNYSSERGLRTFRVDAQGVTETRVALGLIGGGYTRILFSAGRVYGSSGDVADAARGVRIGQFDAGINPSAWAVDTQLGRAYFMNSSNGTLTVFDVNTFQQLGSVYVAYMNSEHPAAYTERLVRWGTDGLALNDGQRIYLFRTPVAAP
ncbi:IPT/TIG domain-containing protein [Longimicrobium sp.]|uniref:IPT/TIG domain-containing protein n=1 Tax=Longimicrobium sp. TaxID=2029185 RepID=UPI002E3689C5|nr:IPT/TIG domain-containing protein [Longimicrobium sp.]HEX6042833.1 IPT/TIG domain-containing protein [Longimicrobium sp.]